VAEPGQLPGPVRAALTGPDGQLLTLIATAPGLGAPAVTPTTGGTTSGDGGSLATAGVGTVATVPGLALLGTLAGIFGAVAGARLIRRRRSTL
jgi:hypothetical protein